MTVADFLASGPQVDPLHEALKAVVRQHSDSHPRSAQKRLGPSEVGHPCARKMVQSLLFGSGNTGTGKPINAPGDPLPAYIGTAGHARLEEALALDNERLVGEGSEPRWLSERKVVVREDLSGTADLYDMQTGTVIDFKFPGSTAFNEYKRYGPSLTYRVQAHLYGAGYRNEGFNVHSVGIWFLPRAGRLASAHLWTEAFDQAIVDDALTRIDYAHNIIGMLELEEHPERLKFVPTSPHNCVWCKYFSPVPHEDPCACPGDSNG